MLVVCTFALGPSTESRVPKSNNTLTQNIMVCHRDYIDHSTVYFHLLINIVIKEVQCFRVTCLLKGQYDTEEYGTIAGVKSHLTNSLQIPSSSIQYHGNPMPSHCTAPTKETTQTDLDYHQFLTISYVL